MGSTSDKADGPAYMLGLCSARLRGATPSPCLSVQNQIRLLYLLSPHGSPLPTMADVNFPLRLGGKGAGLLISCLEHLTLSGAWPGKLPQDRETEKSHALPLAWLRHLLGEPTMGTCRGLYWQAEHRGDTAGDGPGTLRPGGTKAKGPGCPCRWGTGDMGYTDR